MGRTGARASAVPTATSDTIVVDIAGAGAGADARAVDAKAKAEVCMRTLQAQGAAAPEHLQLLATAATSASAATRTATSGSATGSGRNAQFLPFAEALAVVQSVGLANQKEWYAWCKEGRRPPNVPADPPKVYKDGGWQGWVHWLGSSNIKKPSKFAPFGQALTFAQSLGLASAKEWTVWCKEGRRPPNVPSNPNATYKDGGWQGWGHWLGNGDAPRQTKEFLPFAEALAVARSLNLANRFDWEQCCKEGTRPPNVPSSPHQVYTDGGWQGWGHWLGTVKRQGLPRAPVAGPANVGTAAPHAAGTAAPHAAGTAPPALADAAAGTRRHDEAPRSDGIFIPMSQDFAAAARLVALLLGDALPAALAAGFANGGDFRAAVPLLTGGGGAAAALGQAAFESACHGGDAEAVALCLAHCAVNPNVGARESGGPGRTLLTAAASRGDDRVVRALARCPAVDVNMADAEGCTALALASEFGHTECARALLCAPAIDVNAAHALDGTTALHRACFYGHTDCARALLGAPGADPNRPRASDGATPLFIAAYGGFLACVLHLLAADSIDVNRALTSDGATALTKAAQFGHTAVVRALLEAGRAVDVNHTLGGGGWSSLALSAHAGHADVVAALLGADGVDPYLTLADSHETALVLAADRGHLAVVHALLRAESTHAPLPAAAAAARARAFACATHRGFDGCARALREAPPLLKAEAADTAPFGTGAWHTPLPAPAPGGGGSGGRAAGAGNPSKRQRLSTLLDAAEAVVGDLSPDQQQRPAGTQQARDAAPPPNPRGATPARKAPGRGAAAISNCGPDAQAGALGAPGTTVPRNPGKRRKLGVPEAPTPEGELSRGQPPPQQSSGPRNSMQAGTGSALAQAGAAPASSSAPAHGSSTPATATAAAPGGGAPAHASSTPAPGLGHARAASAKQSGGESAAPAARPNPEAPTWANFGPNGPKKDVRLAKPKPKPKPRTVARKMAKYPEYLRGGHQSTTYPSYTYVRPVGVLMRC